MANVYKSPAQVVPSAGVLTTLYSVPALTQAVVSNIHVCNFGDTSASIRIAVRPLGASIIIQHYLFFGLTVSPFDTIQLGDGITMGASDVISVGSSSNNTSFTLSYAEVTAD
jgi:hypothetical protein